jgi:hypothetical protein
MLRCYKADIGFVPAIDRGPGKRSRVIKKLADFLPYILCPLAFFVLLASIQGIILRQAFVAAENRQMPVVSAPVASPKSSRLPAALILP